MSVQRRPVRGKIIRMKAEQSTSESELLGRRLALLGDLARLVGAQAGETEICDQGLRTVLKALPGARGCILLWDGSRESEIRVAATRGEACSPAIESFVRRMALDRQDLRLEPLPDGQAALAVCFVDGEQFLGGLVLERSVAWDEPAMAFVKSVGQVLTSALIAARRIGQSRIQGDLLARRNLELETLRELAERIPGREEKEILEMALDLVLRKLGLDAGWIFWGPSKLGQLELAACHGLQEDFVRRAKSTGIGACLCQDVFATGKLRVARNTLECPRLPDLLPERTSTSHACIPLKFEKGVMGVMNIAARPGQVFTHEELKFLETVGSQICLAVDKARAARAEYRRDAESRALGSLARALGGSLEKERILSAVSEYARELLRVDRCALLLGHQPESLTLAYLSGPPLEGLELGQKADLESLRSRAIPEALRVRAPVAIRDTDVDRRGNPDLARRWKVRSLVLVPLVAHGRILGVLLASRNTPSSWDEGEVELADALARQAAVAIENAGLYQDAKNALYRIQQAQDSMMRNERLAAVGTLASSLAHEVRNPLNSINLQLVLLSRRLERLEASNRAEMEALIDSAKKEIARLNGLVEEFLSLSTLDRISLSEAFPREVVQEALELMAPVAHQRGITVGSVHEGPSSRVRLDPEKMKQVLINLIRNALEAMTEGGKLTVTTRAMEDAYLIEVADTGVGIEPGKDVFDFFVTTKKGGTGLGLPIAKRIVEAHGGVISYRSQPGKGTIFSIALGDETTRE